MGRAAQLNWRAHHATLARGATRHCSTVAGYALLTGASLGHTLAGDTLLGLLVAAAGACLIAKRLLAQVATAPTDELNGPAAQSTTDAHSRIAQMQSDLISTASHEFRTPLTVIRGATDTLRRHHDLLTEIERRELVAAIGSRADVLAEIIESMLIASAVEPPDTTSTELRPVIDEVLRRPSRGAVTGDVPGDLWARCGPVPLGQLVALAVSSTHAKAGSDQTVRLRATPEPEHVLIEVRAAAVGLDDDDVAGIFEPFLGGTGLKPGTADVGLGLYAVLRLAQVHGGTARARVYSGDLVIEVRLPRSQPGTAPHDRTTLTV